MDLPLTLELSNNISLTWWVDASFAVHHDMCSQTSATLSLGKCNPFSMSVHQKINTKSSTEAELVRVSDSMVLVLWTRNFLLQQGFKVRDNVIYQDNQSAILLKQHGHASSGQRTRHINIQYFFITDRVKAEDVSIKYCPTSNMLADFITKPLQGSKFRQMRDIIMNLNSTMDKPQECVGKTNANAISYVTWADVVKWNLVCPLSEGVSTTDGPHANAHGKICLSLDLSPLSRKQ